ncbi:DNA-binding response regulator, OmpR family, contains REC and winged-helix (wHTH) domain [Anaerovirgula multivorans]|uniref:Stage 0 sporulation protein A homolog n=1 Tax=Anaerovirgula multivorans TaxID=312168 RepID=A0A239KSC9_9FIRM|nr:response regulator transcription factor [Anaerovirgula multivorans]SNT20642.1 DNA-binding response regulator, OmpR family, contains REC and winged-helix (wHTH) domain [Anaerovirgula multivorans]
MDKKQILIVDDEIEIADLIEIYLVNEGYSVLKAYSGVDALKILDKESIQLVILDIMMPGIDGLEVCRRIRKEKNIPILIVSAKSEDMDKILGLTIGADDYITKPFNPLELLARVKSQLRRYLYLSPQPTNHLEEDAINMNGLIINKETHRITLFNQEINLTPIEFDILLLLASSPGKVFTVDEIFQKVWKEDYLESDNTVRVHIRKIREKMEIDSKQPFFIKTVWGVGYKFEIPV